MDMFALPPEHVCIAYLSRINKNTSGAWGKDELSHLKETVKTVRDVN
jgi:hypothetical protein